MLLCEQSSDFEPRECTSTAPASSQSVASTASNYVKWLIFYCLNYIVSNVLHIWLEVIIRTQNSYSWLAPSAVSFFFRPQVESMATCTLCYPYHDELETHRLIETRHLSCSSQSRTLVNLNPTSRTSQETRFQRCGWGLSPAERGRLISRGPERRGRLFISSKSSSSWEEALESIDNRVEGWWFSIADMLNQVSSSTISLQTRERQPSSVLLLKTNNCQQLNYIAKVIGFIQKRKKLR